MIALPRARVGAMVIVAWFLLAFLAAVLAIGVRGVPLSGGTLGFALALVLLGAPLMLYGAIARPMIFPFALWAGLVPLDEVIAVRGASLERLLGMLAAGSVVLYLLMRRPTVMPPRPLAPWFAFASFALFSLVWASDVPRSVGLLFTLFSVLVTVALISMVRCDRTDLAWIVGAVLVGGVATAFYTIYIAAHTHLSGEIQRVFFGTRDLVVDPNRLGASLVFPAIIGGVAAASLRNTAARVVCAVAAATSAIGILEAESRGALIGLGIGFLYAILRSRKRTIYAPIGVAFAAMLALYPQVLSRFTDPHYAHASGRTEIWYVGIASFKEHWLLGSGFGAFRDAYQAAYLNVYQATAYHVPVQDAHNLLVLVGVELGLVGLALLGWAIVEQFRLLRSIGKSAGGWYDARIAMEAATIGLLVNALSVDLILTKTLWLCLCAGWVLRAGYRNAEIKAARVASQLSE